MPRRRSSVAALIDVAVMATVRRPFTYRVPDGLTIRAGERVLVPLGNRKVMGVALEPAGRVAPGVKVRGVLRVLDPEPVLSPDRMALGLWIAEYYLAPVGEVFRAMLPLRPEIRRARGLLLTEAGKRRLAELDSSLLEEARCGPEAGLLRYLAARAAAPFDSVRRKFAAVSTELVPRAIAEGWVEISKSERERPLELSGAPQDAAPFDRARSRREVFAVRLRGPLPERATQLSPVAQRIVSVLERQGAVDDHRALLKSARASLPSLKKLSQCGWIELSGSKVGRAWRDIRPSGDGSPAAAGPLPLTAEQAQVLEDLNRRLASREFGVALLHGITASGKTEIYLRLIARSLEQGRAALMLVPEIALTPAVQEQFAARFGARVAVLHSGLSKADRQEEWGRARRGEAKVVLGTRSAVFAPLDGLGVVIVDEEHDPSYKQQETPRYHGRDVAVVRAKLAKALAVLGSATPSLESYWNARQGKYHLATLEERIGGRKLASVEIVDMREEFRETLTQVPISGRLREEIEAQLRSGAQTMILLNRRGYSWFLLCRSCGQTQRCVNCSISLTYHRREHILICHYCGYSAEVPRRCPACGSEHLHYVGEGTEKIEDKLAELFPGARVARLDRDVARRPEHFAKILADFRAGRIDILVGTQLIAKGHDFPGVTLVGVVSVDAGLSLPDFRAAERTFQLLTQAAGRAGRGDAPGRVLVQTFYPAHYAVRLAADQNYAGFFSKEMGFRRTMRYPPFMALANVIAHDKNLERAAKVAREVEGFFKNVDGDARGLKIFGPAPAPLAKIEGRYRIQFLLKSSSRARLNELLRRLANYCDERGIPPASVMIDMDPVSLM